MKLELRELEELFNNANDLTPEARYMQWEYVARALERTAEHIREQQAMLMNNAVASWQKRNKR